MKIQKNFVDYLMIILVIIHITSATILNNRYLPFILGVVLLVVHLFTNKVISKKFIYLVFIWVLVNVANMIYFGTGMLIARLAIITVNLLFLPYLLMSYVGKDFWVKFEQVVYLFTFISLPLYLLNIVFQSEFNNLQKYFEFLTIPSFLVNQNYWSIGLYVNAVSDNGYGINRNNGFMWEPGAFAMIIIWAMIYNWTSIESKLNRKLWVYLVALVTTFSTAGYLALVYVISAFYIKRFRLVNIFLLGATLFVFASYVYRLDFISGKINEYFEVYQDNNISYSQLRESNVVKVNRFQGGQQALIRTLQYPVGYGIVSQSDFSEDEIIYGTNGLGSLLEMWGVAGFILLMVLLWKYLLTIQKTEIGKTSRLLFFIALLIMFFSNPVQRNVFAYLIFIYPFLFQATRIKKYKSI